MRNQDHPPAWRLPGSYAWLATTLILLGMALPWTGSGEQWEQHMQDLRFQWRGPRPPHTRIALATVTNSTRAVWSEPTVFWGRHFAQAIRQARRYGVQWIGLDYVPAVDADRFLVDNAGNSNPLPDAALEAAIADAHGRVVLSYVDAGVTGPILPAPRFLSMPETQGRSGFVDVILEADGVVRRMLRYAPNAPDERSFVSLLAGAGQQGSIWPPQQWTARAENAFWIDYTGQGLPQVSLERLAAGRLSAREQSSLRDAILLIGFADSGNADRFRGAGSGEYLPGVEILANAVVTLCDGSELRRAGPLQEGLISGLLALGMLLLVARLAFGPGLALTLLAGGAWIGAAQWAFNVHNYLLPMATPLLMIAAPWPVLQTLRSRTESQQRRHLANLFSRYVSSEVLAYLMEDPRRQELGGRGVEVTILFLDIRGFTGYAEQRDPAAIMEELNALFAALVPVIDRHGGYLHKFTGDGLIAIFGAPLALDHHAGAAMDAALAIGLEVRKVNMSRMSNEQSAWHIGCGIHTGRVVCGSLGVAKRAEFTVIGDTVNLASRLEALNKEFDSQIVFSQATYEAIEAPPAVNGPFDIEVRGRRERVRVYTIRQEQQ
jgi:class 3 adenylate cyclase/CHASE2 domain-containing sensor protein